MPTKISLKAARVNAGLSQEEAAKKIGVDRCTLSRWEQRPEIVKPIYFPKISAAYGISTDFIFFSQ